MNLILLILINILGRLIHANKSIIYLAFNLLSLVVVLIQSRNKSKSFTFGALVHNLAVILLTILFAFSFRGPTLKPSMDYYLVVTEVQIRMGQCTLPPHIYS